MARIGDNVPSSSTDEHFKDLFFLNHTKVKESLQLCITEGLLKQPQLLLARS